MKKLVCLLLAALLLTSSAFAVTVSEAVPCEYDDIVLFRKGDLLQTYRNDHGVVCRMDGTAVLDTAETQVLLDGCIHVGAYDGQSLWSLDGEKLTGTWDDIPEVAHELAICGKGSWGRPATLYGKYGAIDLKTGKWIVPQEYSSLRFSHDGTCLIAENADGKRAFDLTGAEIPVPASEADRVVYGNGTYRMTGGTGLYYSDGGLAVPAVYSAIEAVCGDVIFAQKENENTLYCLSLTGQVLNRYPGGYVAFSAPDCDFVLLGKNREVEEIAVVNRWGETISPYTKGDGLLSGGGSVGKGLELVNASTGKTRWLTADGREVPCVENGVFLPNLGLILVNGENPALLDLDGNAVVPAGKYRAIGTDNGYYSIGRRGVRPDGLVVQNAAGKYGLLRVDSGYAYPAHAWAQAELDAAIAAGILPEEQRRDWRNSCTRGDFCRLVSVLTEKAAEPPAEFINIAFADTTDAAILHAARLGIVNGVGGGNFAPERPVTRQEAAVMLARAAKLLKLEAAGEEKTFDDRASFADWAAEGIGAITRIVGGGTPVMQGVSESLFAPLGTYTREQAALTMLRLFRAMQSAA